MTDTTGKIAPDEGREIDLVLAGTKPLAVIEKRKDPEQYARALQLSMDTATVIPQVGAEGLEVLVALDHAAIRSYHDALAMPAGDARTWCIGKCFGYSDESIAEFITNPPACDCSKCSAAKLVKNDDARRTQYHAK